MKIAILETIHFQYGLTQSAIFEGHELHFFVTEHIKNEMHQYQPELCKGTFHIIKDLEVSADEIIAICNKLNTELLLLSPVFGFFDGVLKIAKNIPCKKVITIHNLNFWLKSRYRTPHSYKERKLKQEIVNCFDYIAVEDFIYNYLKNDDKATFDKYKFIYIPFTIFDEKKVRKYHKTNTTLKVVLPGSIHKDRRRYENVIEVIKHFASKKDDISFSFAGIAIEEYGKWVVSQLDEANKIKPGIATYFGSDKEIVPDMFLREMETSDLVLSTSTTEFKALGTTEYIGKTKPTAAIHDMMSFELPGLLPSSLTIPENLKGSVFNYENASDLKKILQELLDKPEVLHQWKEKAKINSRYFTAAQIRKNLPFFYNQCSRCIMDNINDPQIFFDKEGHCNYCNSYFDHINNQKTKKTYQFESIVPLLNKIKAENKNHKYNCIVGISGGIDSAYLVYKLVELGLRPLAVHFDNGWNSEVATQNIEMLLKKLNVDLYTSVIDWEEFKDLQISFLKAGVIDIELLTDYAIISVLRKTSAKYKTKYIFTGHNSSTEFILPFNWFHFKLDSLNIKAIHNKFGKQKMKSFPYLGYLKLYYQSKYLKTKTIPLLDYINYNKAEAQKLLADKFGWKNYGAKHNESIFTRFYQNYILPVKFNVDKRKAHLSSLICSGQMTREEALKEISIEIWKSPQTLEDKTYVLKKLEIDEKTFDGWMKEKPVPHLAYPSYLTRHNKIIKSLKNILGNN